MTRSLYAAAAGRVIVYGGLLVGLLGGLVVLLCVAAVWYVGPVLQPLREAARQQGQGEALAGLVGLLCGLGLALLPLLIVVLPLVLCDRCYGLRCPNCCRSVTLSCPQAKVLRTGKCSRCGAVLFEAANTMNTTRRT